MSSCKKSSDFYIDSETHKIELVYVLDSKQREFLTNILYEPPIYTTYKVLHRILKENKYISSDLSLLNRLRRKEIKKRNQKHKK